MHEALLWSVVGCTFVLMLWRPRDIAEVWWVWGGVALLIASRQLSLRNAGKAVARGLDVYLFLTGMMLLSEIAREHGVFDWFASHAVKRAGGSCAKLFTLVYGVGIAVTALMSNDATAVVMTPAVLSAAKRAGTVEDSDAFPYLFACAMVANAASFLLPISNPANLVVFAGGSLPPISRWLETFLLPSAVAITITYLVLRLWYRRELSGNLDESPTPAPLAPAGKMVLWGIGCTSLALFVASAFKRDLGGPACVLSLLIVVAVSWRSSNAQESLWSKLREPFFTVSWSVLPLVAGLYCIVEAADQAGALSVSKEAVHFIQHWPLWKGSLALGLGLGALDNVFNNLSVGLLCGRAVQEAHLHGLLARSVLLGIDLGPNLSVTGSLATILWLIRIRRDGLNVSAWAFLRIGIVCMPLALAGALAALFLSKR